MDNLSPFAKREIDSPQPVEIPHMMTVARKWLAAENERMVLAGETAYCESPAHIVGWLIAEVQRLRHATPREGTSQGECTITDAERAAIQRAIDSQQNRAADMHSRSWTAAAIDDDCDTLRKLMERLT